MKTIISVPTTLFLMSIQNIALAQGLSGSQAEASELVYVGSCTWGNRSIASCTHKAGNALASFYVHRADNTFYVHNRITATDVDYCQIPTEMPLSTELRLAAAGSGFSWKDDGAVKPSRLTLSGSVINEVQLSTGSHNYEQLRTGKPSTAYAPCFLVEALGVE